MTYGAALTPVENVRQTRTRSAEVYARLDNTDPLILAANDVCSSRYLFKNEFVSLPVGVFSGMKALDEL